MIRLTRVSAGGEDAGTYLLNSTQIHRMEWCSRLASSTPPQTVITMKDGTSYRCVETPQQVMEMSQAS